MGLIPFLFSKRIVEKVGSVINRFETDNSFTNIPDSDLIFIPKAYIYSKVSAEELESVWRRLPISYQNDSDLLAGRPCQVHFTQYNQCVRRRECLLCKYDDL